jgi:hypothetical protein
MWRRRASEREAWNGKTGEEGGDGDDDEVGSQRVQIEGIAVL